MANLVVDSCIVIGGYRPKETGHAEAVAFFDAVKRRGDRIVLSVTTLWDLAAVSHHPVHGITREELEGGIDIAFDIVEVTEALFDQTHLAGRFALKGPDRIIVSVAKVHGARLITADGRMLQHAPYFGVTALTPEAYVAEG